MTNPTTEPAPTPPRGRGRPALAIGDHRDIHFQVNLSEADKIKLRRLARAAGKSMSAWLVEQVRRAP